MRGGGGKRRSRLGGTDAPLLGALALLVKRLVVEQRKVGQQRPDLRAVVVVVRKRVVLQREDGELGAVGEVVDLAGVVDRVRLEVEHLQPLRVHQRREVGDVVEGGVELPQVVKRTEALHLAQVAARDPKDLRRWFGEWE